MKRQPNLSRGVGFLNSHTACGRLWILSGPMCSVCPLFSPLLNEHAHLHTPTPNNTPCSSCYHPRPKFTIWMYSDYPKSCGKVHQLPSLPIVDEIFRQLKKDLDSFHSKVGVCCSLRYSLVCQVAQMKLGKAKRTYPGQKSP